MATTLKLLPCYVRLAVVGGALLLSCRTQEEAPPPAGMQLARLDQNPGVDFAAIRDAFTARNPGYDLHFFRQTTALKPQQTHRLAFLQAGSGNARMGADSSRITVGDIVYLRPQASLTVDSLVDLLVFTVPEAMPDDIPVFIRPDWDPNITDTPGGCATETNAYRRILLTWQGKNGPYLYHSLNAHRVRIMNSFTHYHPQEGGFDEFYLVQMALPEAVIITSGRVDLLTRPQSVRAEDIPGLMTTTPLQVGHLVYLPRGVAHRGLGGVLAQVITVPGFVPGSEIGLDHHLKAINERLSLQGEQALPYHAEAASEVVIK